MLNVYTILFRLLHTVAAIIYEVVHEDRLCCLLHPYRTTFLVLGAAPSAIHYGVVVDSHLSEWNHFAVAGIRKLECIGAGVVDDVVGNIELAASFHVDSLATVGGIAGIGKDVVYDHAVAAGEVCLVVVVVVEEAVSNDELAVHIAEVEGRHTAVDGSLEQFVLERCRRFRRCGSGIGDVDMAEHYLLGIVSADYSSPVFSLLGVGSESDRLLCRSHTIEIAKHHDFYRHLNLRLACHGDSWLDV